LTDENVKMAAERHPGKKI